MLAAHLAFMPVKRGPTSIYSVLKLNIAGVLETQLSAEIFFSNALFQDCDILAINTN
jgi:hypothetical protein